MPFFDRRRSWKVDTRFQVWTKEARRVPGFFVVVRSEVPSQSR